MSDKSPLAAAPPLRERIAPPSTTPADLAELVALQAVGWPFTTLTLTTLLFWLGIPIGAYHLWVALGLFLVIGSRFADGWRIWLKASLCLALFVFLGGAALQWLYDFSGDGQWYHLPAILALAQGWNPFHLHRLAEWNPAFEQAIASSDASYPSYVYVEHYAKGAWIVAAAAYRGTGLLEATKVFNLLYLLAVYLTTVAFLSRLGLSRWWSHGLAAAAAANPVALYQTASFFVDGQLACLCTLVTLSSVDYLHRRRKQALFLFGASIVLLANVKFTGVVFAGGLVGGLAVLAWFSDRRAEVVRYAAVGASALALAIILVGYQPYVTNLLDYGHPFYPALGREDGRNVQWHSAPMEFMAMNPAEKLVRSLFARSSDSEGMPVWKPPFAVSKPELYTFFNTEPRYGGFGPLFGSVLALALVGFIIAKPVTPRRFWNAAAALAALVVATALLNPEAWWARLSPQLWLVPVTFVCAMALGGSRWPRGVAAVLLCVLLGNSMLVAALNLGRAVEKNLLFRGQLAHLQAMSATDSLRVTVHPSFRMVTELRLMAWSIPYQVVPTPACAMPFYFSYPASAQASACSSL